MPGRVIRSLVIFQVVVRDCGLRAVATWRPSRRWAWPERSARRGPVCAGRVPPIASSGGRTGRPWATAPMNSFRNNLGTAGPIRRVIASRFAWTLYQTYPASASSALARQGDLVTLVVHGLGQAQQRGEAGCSRTGPSAARISSGKHRRVRTIHRDRVVKGIRGPSRPRLRGLVRRVRHCQTRR